MSDHAGKICQLFLIYPPLDGPVEPDPIASPLSTGGEAMSYRAMALVAASLLFATQSYSQTAQSDRMGGGGGGKGAAGVTTVKSGKSNTNDRMGGGGAKGAASVQTGAAKKKCGRTYDPVQACE